MSRLLSFYSVIILSFCFSSSLAQSEEKEKKNNVILLLPGEEAPELSLLLRLGKSGKAIDISSFELNDKRLKTVFERSREINVNFAVSTKDEDDLPFSAVIKLVNQIKQAVPPGKSFTVYLLAKWPKD